MDAQQPLRPRQFRSHLLVFLLASACFVLIVGSGIVGYSWRADDPWLTRLTGRSPRAVPSPESPWLNARPGVKFVGDAVCARCHPDIAETFRQHPMGRSLAPIASAPAAGIAGPTGTATFRAGRSVFTIERRDGREFHRESVLDGDKVVAQVEAEVAYAVGSATRGITYLIERDGRLFESPITWYTPKQRWDLSPGYEKSSSHFDRPIDPNCLFCHSNRVEPVALSTNRYEEPIFRGHAIGCERCHGPGELHARDPGHGPGELHARDPGLSGGRDPKIVNPRHLDPALRGNVCEQCHLVADWRVNRPGREAFDYRPGLPLSEFVVDYTFTADAGHKLVGQVEQMKDSRCFRASRGRLGCVSCHDPHQLPDPEEKVAYFRRRCLACHEDRGCKLPEPARRAGDREDSCIECHMPLSKTVDVAHVAVRDHRILRDPDSGATESSRVGSPLPMVRLDDDAGPGRRESLDREMAIALVTKWSQLPQTPRVRSLGPRLISALDQVVSDNPDDLEALRMKAQILSFTGRYAKALEIAGSLLELAPSYELLLDDYTSYAIDRKDFRAALGPARRAVALNPWSAADRERLAFLSMQCQDWTAARREAREALRLDPFLRFARMFLVQCLLHDRDVAAARNELATLVKLHPDLAGSFE